MGKFFAYPHGEPILSGGSKRQKSGQNTSGGARFSSLQETKPKEEAVETVVLSEENRPAHRRARIGEPLSEEQLERRVHDAGARRIASETGRSEWRRDTLDRKESKNRTSDGESEQGKALRSAETRGQSRGEGMQEGVGKVNGSPEGRNRCRAEKGSITVSPKPSARAASPHAQGGSVAGITGHATRPKEEETVCVGDGRAGEKGQVGGLEKGREERNVGKEEFQQTGAARDGASGYAALVCDECDSRENQELMLRCAARGCSTIVHVYCLDEEMEAMPSGEWFCAECEKGREEQDGTEGRCSASRSRRCSIRDPSGTEPEITTESGQQDESDQRSRYVLGGPPMCEHPGCTERAWFGERRRGATVPQVCYMHKSPGMVRKNTRICEVRGCTKAAHYNFPDGKGRRRCGAHKEDGMFALSNLCAVKGCFTMASFGWSPGRKPTRCSLHKCEGMVTTGKLCRQQGCSVRANYGYAGVGRQFCKHHSQEGMIHNPHMKCGLRGIM